MPLWGKDENFKARLEQKLCVAKETPEPVFDLTDCNLNEVPSGVYSMCRVFLKEVLLLFNNRLNSLQNGGLLKDLHLLRVLDLSNNKFSSLPEDIKCLSNLEVFNLENNLLKRLPSSFASLKKLHTLNLRKNKLNPFPMVLCNVLCLQTLDISYNPKLKSLPNELCNLNRLSKLTIDASNIIHPPSDICEEGSESILKYLCNECGKEFIPNQDLPPESACDNSIAASSVCYWDSASYDAKYQLYQRAKEQKRKELLQMEELLRETDLLQAQCVLDSSKRKQQLLEDCAMEQDKLEREILQLQNKKDVEKKKLLKLLIDIEDHSEKLMMQLKKMNERNYEDILERLELDRVEFEEMVTIKQKELEEIEKQNILNSMNTMLQAEEKQRQLEAQKLESVRRLSVPHSDDTTHLENILTVKAMDQRNLINELLKEERLQKEAFEALQLQRDKRHLELTYQVNIIEEELSKLTLAEINKHELKSSIELNVLSERRIELAHLLNDLLEAKQKREIELKKRLEEIEEKRLNEVKDFWLLQFEKLMDKRPPEIVDAELNMDQMVRTILIEAGATLFIPLFAVKSITLTQLLSMTFLDLKKLGILDDFVCEAILSKCIEYFPPIENEKLNKEISNSMNELMPVPSAPEEEELENILPSAPEAESDITSDMPSPSAPMLQDVKLWCQTECVICLDQQSTMVFIPCGHVCCCGPCSSDLLTCPMCRQEVSIKYVLTFSQF